MDKLDSQLVQASFRSFHSFQSPTLNSQPIPVMSYREVSASIPTRILPSLVESITWIVAIASSNVMPSFLSGENAGSAMSSNLEVGGGGSGKKDEEGRQREQGESRR
jgi:hypothetical protein